MRATETSRVRDGWHPTPATRGMRWPAYAAAAWAGVFALRGLYWALGGTTGLGTLSRELQQLAADDDPTVAAALWIAVAMLAGLSVLSVWSARPELARVPGWLPVLAGRRLPCWALVGATGGAAGVLLAHGGSYLLAPLLGDGTTAELRWYGLLWGPWFVLGGALLLTATHRLRRTQLSGSGGRWMLWAATVAGAMLIVTRLLVGPLVGSPPAS